MTEDGYAVLVADGTGVLVVGEIASIDRGWILGTAICVAVALAV